MERFRFPLAALVIGALLLPAGCVGSNQPEPTPIVAGCPAGSDPNVPGPADQTRPPRFGGPLPLAVDSRAGQLVAVEEHVGTWAYDLCTNRWRQLVTEWSHAQPRSGWLVYDPGSDLTYAFGDGGVWTFSIRSRAWTRLPDEDYPDIGTSARFAYDPATRRVFASGSHTAGLPDVPRRSLWAYELASSRWTPVNQGSTLPRDEGSALLSYDTRVDRLVMVLTRDESTEPVLESQTWLFDPDHSSWERADTRTPDLVFGWLPWGTEVVYDADLDRTVLFSMGTLATYDATASRWTSTSSGAGWPPTTVDEETGASTSPLRRTGHVLAHDPIHRRLLLFGGDVAGGDPDVRNGTDAWAYHTDTGTWTLILPALP